MRGYADRTIAAYRVHAAAAIANWRRGRRPARFLRQFAQALPSGARVLDYGCGIGTDLAWLKAHGFRVEGMDGALEFVLEARRCCPGISIAHARFETVAIPPARYDGIWCRAALIHVPPERLRHQLEKLRRSLRPGGVLGITMAWGRRKGFTSRDWIPGRYVAGYSKAEAAALFGTWAVRAARVASHDGRQGRWIQVLASPRPPSPVSGSSGQHRSPRPARLGFAARSACAPPR